MGQRSKSSYKGYKESQLPTNGSGSITAAAVRLLHEDLADSVLFITDHLLDEDNMASDSATQVPSQQSVKAYVDASAGVGGSTGAVDNAILRADGTGGSTVQSSSLSIDDNANLTVGDTGSAPAGNPTGGMFVWSGISAEGNSLNTRSSTGYLGRVPLRTKVTINGGATLRNIGTSPQTIIAAPGANKLIFVHSILVSYNYGTATYDFNATEHPIITYSGGSTKWLLNQGTMNSGTSFHCILNDSQVNADKSSNVLANTALVITTDDGGNATTGDGDLDIIIFYSIEDVNT